MKKLIIVLLGLIALSVGLYFVLPDTETIRAFIDSTGMWAVVVYISVRVVGTIFLCFVPACSMAFDLLAVALFGANFKTFVICLISISICSCVMYLLGRFGAYKLIEKIVGKEDLEKANKLIKEKGLVYYPVFMACGGFPDDALVCMAGITKMNVLYFLLTTIIGRSIGCATTVFGIALIPFSEFETFYDWFVFGGSLVAYGFLIIKSATWVNKKINKKGE